MVSKNKKRVMITLSNQILFLLDKLCEEYGTSYSDYFTQVVIEKSLERKKD